MALYLHTCAQLHHRRHPMKQTKTMNDVLQAGLFMAPDPEVPFSYSTARENASSWLVARWRDTVSGIFSVQDAHFGSSL
ncbi:uncharacterized protein B0T23DRAFT_320076 [Neurospora hispaniola]|uniref:Uncharacterized protein n=1 Tax=Neurospora hispaniola TaxID=588809 RepID=A0AAJ0I5Z3_9PEZI|nr:hypothetical protein B0T23DRAFT_320076 [Neurospora hispaniola]